ncbi:urea ABC transporter ATPase protein UrtE [Spiribacter salinus M19-40]|jgi:amino acid/amide ABC transporter ATP-binding protein 2, HAAT family (TC 3.A.1.4.-)|uniref:Urea ABC transporter ATPase protein UrtE n=1 Tax=Spiribacter salinus M19-40 TaxID=1260251 RepID=R4V7P4_9GAMM|nr:urea ABC transporter ATP-binding subunit UrtE [Spiribacter salinus]AGM41025.1 urea ABC transporter ATPase protein UrtE [Spiribacter salinus M19-40]MBY5268265.1 urea ABC transporter ATP-binding subunit UrtE [Spiribacter salinus]
MLSIRKLNQYYGESHTLWDVDCEVPAQGCTCLMGRNGVGKTTVLKTVMGLLPAASGEIEFDGRRIESRPAEQRARGGIGYVPQGREIFPLLSVEENLRVARTSVGRRDIPTLVHELFPVLHDMRHRRGGDLSGGQQQQLAIGRALCLEPRLLILDEPTEGIQPNIVREIGEVIQRLNRDQAMTVLLVEQKLPFARRTADQFVILDRGRSVADGRMDELGDDLVRRYLTV